MSNESRQERLVRAQARLYGITIKDGIVSKRGPGEGPLAGAQPRVESAGEVDKRVTATRFVLTGPLAFALRKKKDHRRLFATIGGPGYQIFAEVHDADEKAHHVLTLALYDGKHVTGGVTFPSRSSPRCSPGEPRPRRSAAPSTRPTPTPSRSSVVTTLSQRWVTCTPTRLDTSVPSRPQALKPTPHPGSGSAM
jgi:hypothetical protein